MKLSDIAAALSAEVIGDGAIDIVRLVHPADADRPGDLAVALAKDALEALPRSRARAAVLPAAAPRPGNGVALVAYAGPERLAVAILTALFDPGPVHGEGIHPTAVIADDAIIGAGVSIGPGSVVGPRSRIGDGTAILSQATIGADVTIGRDCVIDPGVRIGDRVRMGDRVIVHFNTVIGCDGFSYIPVRNPDGTPGAEGLPRRTHSLGTVVIGDDVEIGAGTTIDRATFRETRIGRGTKIDNQVQIAHNVTIGESCLICGMAGIAGSVVIGDRTIVAAGAGIADHINVGADAVIVAGAGVVSRVPPGATVSGAPAARHDLSLNRVADVGRLRMLYPRVDDLKKRIEALEKAAKGG